VNIEQTAYGWRRRGEYVNVAGFFRRPGGVMSGWRQRWRQQREHRAAKNVTKDSEGSGKKKKKKSAITFAKWYVGVLSAGIEKKRAIKKQWQAGVGLSTTTCIFCRHSKTTGEKQWRRPASGQRTT